MRLLNVKTLEFKQFNETDLPPYAILSHCWRDEEVSYQDMCWLQRLNAIPSELKSNPLYPLFLSATNGASDQLSANEGGITNRAGYEKIVRAAKVTQNLGYAWVWVDTCCVDKSSSAELQEAINSMYRWYQKSDDCLVYLDDVDHSQMSSWLTIASGFSASRWVQRGWTLQELIAPSSVTFYDVRWREICQKHNALRSLCLATGIPEHVLATGDLSTYSVAQRMSWASQRSTTRVEDTAYCLMGLFDIHMPMLYGEGDKAFIRLQEEIMKHFTDDSIFAWKALGSSSSIYRGLLARSPREFEESSMVERGIECAMSSSNLGLHVPIPIRLIKGEKDYYFAMLTAHDSTIQSSNICVKLRRLEADDKQYARVDPHLFFPRGVRASSYQKCAIYVRHQIRLPYKFEAKEMHGFYVRLHEELGTRQRLTVNVVSPPANLSSTNIITIPSDAQLFTSLLSVQVSPDITSPNEPRSCHCPKLQLLVGFSRQTGRGWCIFVESKLGRSLVLERDQEKFIEGEMLWEESLLSDDFPFSNCDKHSANSAFVSLRPRIRDDRICLDLTIGLLHYGVAYPLLRDLEPLFRDPR